MNRGIVLLSACLMLVAAPVLAQDNPGEGLETERFKPALDSQGLVWTEAGQGERSGDLNLGFYLHYSHNPLVVENADGDVIHQLVGNRLAADFVVSMGLTDWLTIGLDVPAFFYQDGGLRNQEGQDIGLTSAGLGDIRVAPKLTVLRQERFGVSLALHVPVTLPSGDEMATIGNSTVTATPTLALSRSLFDNRLLLALNLGFWIRDQNEYRDLTADHELLYRLGARFRFTDRWAVLGEGSGGARLTTIGENKPNETSLEWLLAVQFLAPADLQLTVGGAAGSLPGWGTPEFRAFVGLLWAPRVKDRDGDGVADEKDRCPDEKGEATNAGCPWKDSDGDGLTDDQDNCPNEAGPKENKGCPWGDADGDGVRDNRDRCPEEAGAPDNGGCPWADTDGDGVTDNLDKCTNDPGPASNDGCPFLDSDGDKVRDDDDRCPKEPGAVENGGCPWGDTDGDGMTDNLDKCPQQAEDKDGFEDEDGCPDPDNDKDGVLDKDDKCPNEPETINGVKDDDGCPDKGKVLVIVKDEKIEILQKIYFNTGKATIQPRSFSLLNQIAQTIRAHDEIKRVRIEGHTDSQGSDAFNLSLSQKRAESVREYLLGRAIDPDRLLPMGYGESRPVFPNNTAAGREQNRRVEFVILSE